MRRIKVKAPAKINLFLEVLRRRDDGYHEIESLMQMVGLYDELIIEESPENRIVLECPDFEELAGPDNLVYRAAQELSRFAGIKKGVRIVLHKNIPLAAGLGGGSADAAAALGGLNTLWNLSLSVKDLAELGAKLGSDVPFFFFGPLAAAKGRGEKIESLPAGGEKELILLNPKINVSTREIYEALSLQLTNAGQSIKMHLPILGNIKREKSAENLREWCGHFFNRLEQAALPRFPLIGECMELLRSAGLWGVRMSGSGPTVFAFFPDGYPHQQKNILLKQSKERGWWAVVCSTITENPLYLIEELPMV